MNDREEPVAGSQRLTELFSALRDVVAENPRLQALIREQEQDKRQVLLNMSSVLRLVEQGEGDAGAEEDDFQPRAIRGWMGSETPESEGEGAAPQALPQPQAPAVSGALDGETPPSMNFFDKAFLKSLKISL